MLKALLVLVSFAFIFPADAKAYLDPGSGSYIVQIIVAALLGVSLTIKMQWHRITSFFTGKRVRDKDDDKSEEE